MQDTPFLLAYERIRTGTMVKSEGSAGQDDEEEEDGLLLQYRLSLAREMVVVDDTTLVNDFRDSILTCPQDDIIEAFVEVRITPHHPECWEAEQSLYRVSVESASVDWLQRLTHRQRYQKTPVPELLLSSNWYWRQAFQTTFFSLNYLAD